MAAAKNRQPDRTPYGIGRLVGITYRKVQFRFSRIYYTRTEWIRTSRYGLHRTRKVVLLCTKALENMVSGLEYDLFHREFTNHFTGSAVCLAYRDGRAEFFEPARESSIDVCRAHQLILSR